MPQYPVSSKITFIPYKKKLIIYTVVDVFLYYADNPLPTTMIVVADRDINVVVCKDINLIYHVTKNK
jgi:hypothetical protein